MKEIDNYWDSKLEEERDFCLTNLLDMFCVDTGDQIKPYELLEVQLFDGIDFRKVGYGWFKWCTVERRFILEADKKNDFNKEYEFTDIDLKDLYGYSFKKIKDEKNN